MEDLYLKKAFFGSIVLFIFLLASLSYAQDATKIESATRETDILGSKEKIERQLRRPARQIAEETIETEPTEEEGKKFFVKKIILTGCESFPAEDFLSLTEKYENKEVSFEGLNTLARQIEREYLKRGIIAAVFIPPQESKNQTVTLNVVEAKMGTLNISKHKYFNSARLKYYWEIMPNEIMRYDLITKYLQLMNKNPDREVKAALAAGHTPGTTDVQLNVKTNFPAHVIASFDNEGAGITGRARKGIGMRHNNFLGLDDTLLSGYTYGKEFRSTYAYHSIPLGYNGTSVLYGWSKSHSSPKEEYADNVLRSNMQNTTLSLSQDLFKKNGEYLGDIHGGFNTSDKAITQTSGVYSRDILRVINLGGNFTKKGFGSVTTFSPELRQGLDAFGASSRGNPLASRQAKSVFTSLGLGVQYRKALPSDLQANLRFRSLLASNKLMPQEEFSLGGIDSVRGYPSSDYLADNAALINAELLIPSIFIPEKIRLPFAQETLREQITTLAFLDYGWGMRKGALPTEINDIDMVGAGAGIRARLFDQALLRLEWGFVIGHPAVTEGGHSQFHFSVDFQDKTPEEIERIEKILYENNIKRIASEVINAELNRPASPIKDKMEKKLRYARACYRQAKFSEAKKYYENIDSLSKSLYNQTEDYVRSVSDHNIKVKEKINLAAKDFEAGDTQEAKKIWQEIIAETNIKPLVLEF